MSQEIIGGPPAPPARLLDSPRRVRLEMVRVYKDMRTGVIETQDGSRLIFALTAIARIIEASDLEARLAALEADIYDK